MTKKTTAKKCQHLSIIFLSTVQTLCRPKIKLPFVSFFLRAGPHLHCLCLFIFKIFQSLYLFSFVSFFLRRCLRLSLSNLSSSCNFPPLSSPVLVSSCLCLFLPLYLPASVSSCLCIFLPLSLPAFIFPDFVSFPAHASFCLFLFVSVRHVTGNDKDYLRLIPRVVW